MQLKNNCTRNSQNCTRFCLVQLLDCYSYSYSLIVYKYMRLPILILVYIKKSLLVDTPLLRKSDSYVRAESPYIEHNVN